MQRQNTTNRERDEGKEQQSRVHLQRDVSRHRVVHVGVREMPAMSEIQSKTTGSVKCSTKSGELVGEGLF